jgi:hypothetical protein
MSPFDTRHLPQLAATWGKRHSNAVGRPAKPETKTSRILERLRQGPATAHELAEIAEVETVFHVVGLLKSHQQIGQVQCKNGKYFMNEAFIHPKLFRAAEMLRAAGWIVKEPT